MDRKQFNKYVLKLDLIRKKARIKGDRQQVKAITKLRNEVVRDFESKGRIGQRPIKGRLMERSPSALIKACDYAQGKKDSPLSYRVFDFVKAKR